VAYFLVVGLNLRAVCAVQSKCRSSSVRRVAVSSTGCRPCKIASTSSGLKEGVTNERSDVAPGDAFVPPPILEGHSLGRTLGRTCSDVRSMFPILWQVGYTINDNVSVWVTRPDESYKKEQ